MNTPAVLALVGPTGAGKSSIALETAERLDAEIVAVDAFTVYRGMDIGTAKPSAADRARVVHHGIDLLHPSEDSTVEWFQGEARRAIRTVLDRGRRPLLVGGSGLYFRAVVDRLAFPPTDTATRARIEARFSDAPEAAHAELQRLDPAAAGRMDPGNLRRAVRALEVLELTGRPFSEWRTAWDCFESVYPHLTVVGLALPRDVLAARLDERVEAMVAGGFLEEVRRLRADPSGLGATARQAIGYAEMLAHLEGRTDLAGAVEATKRRSRRYARRQSRWFVRDPRVQWKPPHEAADALVGARPRGEVTGR